MKLGMGCGANLVVSLFFYYHSSNPVEVCNFRLRIARKRSELAHYCAYDLPMLTKTFHNKCIRWPIRY